jgi:hypothetical protein
VAHQNGLSAVTGSPAQAGRAGHLRRLPWADVELPGQLDLTVSRWVVSGCRWWQGTGCSTGVAVVREEHLPSTRTLDRWVKLAEGLVSADLSSY